LRRGEQEGRKGVFSGFAKVSPEKTRFVVLASLGVYFERLFQTCKKRNPCPFPIHPSPAAATPSSEVRK
jgi:hypothetical protein